MKYSFLLSAGAFALCAADGLAQEGSSEGSNAGTSAAPPTVLETIEVSAFRPVSLEDVTASVSVLDAEQLSVRNAPFLADQLRALPGVGISRSGAVGGLTQLRTRGSEGNHTLILIDGIEVSDPATGESDLGLLSGFEASRIEFARGEQSALYGSDAIGGVVSVSTGGEGLRGMIEAGSRNSGRGLIAYDQDFGGGYLGGALSGFVTDGIDTSGLNVEEDGSSNWSAALRAGMEFGPGWKLSSLAYYGESSIETDPDLDFDGRLDNANRETDSEQFLAGVSLLGETGLVDHVLRANWSSTVRSNIAEGDFSNETTGERSKFSWSPGIGFETGEIQQNLTGVVEFEREEFERVDTNTFFGDPNQTQEFETFGVAGQYRLNWAALDADLSLRHDENDGLFDDATTWRAGMAWSFDFGGRVRASIGEGVKNPTFTELFGFFPSSFVGNPDLVPEKSTGYEVGYSQAFGSFSGELVYFSAELEDEIFTAFNPDFTSTALNRDGASERSGVEFTANWQVSDALTLDAMVTQVQSTNDSGTDEIRVPEWTGSVSGRWVSDFGTFGLAADYVGEQLDTDFGSFPFQDVTLDSYTLVSATAEWPITDHLALTMRAENLLDADAVDVFGFASPGVAGFVGLRLR